MRDDRPLIRTRDDLLELIAHALRLQLSYLSKDQALAVADHSAHSQGCRVIDPAAQIMPAAREAALCKRRGHSAIPAYPSQLANLRLGTPPAPCAP